MTIYINGRFLTQPQTGVQRFAREVLVALDELLLDSKIDFAGHSLVCLVPPSFHGENPWKKIEIRSVGRLSGNLWEQLDLLWYSRQGLLVNLGNIAPIFHPNNLAVLHDASVFAYPQAYSFSFRLKYQIILRWLSHFAKSILVVSEFSRNELSRYCGLKPANAKLIQEGCEHILKIPPDESVFNQFDIGSRPYILSIGSRSYHKNLQSVSEVAQQMDGKGVDFVILGGVFDTVFQNSSVRSETVHDLGYVTDAQLHALYKRAMCLVFPSFYEGFGLPLLEAMAVGCPVVASSAASIPEVCGDAAIYFDPHDPNELKQAIVSIMNDADCANSLRQAGYERVAQFSWYHAALQLAAEMNRLIS